MAGGETSIASPPPHGGEADAQPPRKKRRTKEEKEAARPKPPEHNPKGGCDVWIPKKGRFCNGPREKGTLFCGHHGGERVPCPINPNHTVKKCNLEEHKLVCQDRRRLPPVTEAYYRKGANAGGAPAAVGAAPSKESIAAAVEDMKAFLDTHTLFEDIEMQKHLWPGTAEAAAAEGDAGDDEDDDDDHGAAAPAPATGKQLKKHEKHAEQIGSMLGHLHALGAVPLRPITVTLHGPTKPGDRPREGAGAPPPVAPVGKDLRYMEFGCGKGSLAVSVARVLYGEQTEDPDAAVYLVDRSNFRRKCLHNSFRRIFVDLQDMVLDGVEGLRGVVGFSKHLCGCATDFTVRACARTPELMHSLVIALCCHHRCLYSAYLNHEYLAKHGVTPARFEALKKISSWTVDGDDADGGAKRRLGRKAKRFLDFGRVLWLRERGASVRLVHFVEESTTPENCLLIATFPQDFSADICPPCT